jgi:hypothetical protein
MKVWIAVAYMPNQLNTISSNKDDEVEILGAYSTREFAEDAGKEYLGIDYLKQKITHIYNIAVNPNMFIMYSEALNTYIHIKLVEVDTNKGG